MSLAHAESGPRRVARAVAALAAAGPLGQLEGDEDEAVRRRLAPHDLRAARQRAVEEAHLLLRRQRDHRRAVGDAAGEGEVARGAADVAAPQRVRPRAHDADAVRVGAGLGR